MTPRWIVIASTLLLGAVGCGDASSSGGEPDLNANRSSATSSVASSAPTTRSPTSAAAAGTAVDVIGAPTPVTLGFNNAAQMIGDGFGDTLLVWVYDNKVQLGRLSEGGVLSDIRTVGGSRATLPAIAAAGGLVAVSWIESLGRGALGCVYPLGSPSRRSG